MRTLIFSLTQYNDETSRIRKLRNDKGTEALTESEKIHLQKLDKYSAKVSSNVHPTPSRLKLFY